MKVNGAELLVQCLMEQGVDTIFGFPGGAVLNIYDALYKHRDSIRHILTSHEQGAAHAADGYARASGKVGVCMATSGPGATNLVTGIATAYMDSVPMVAITGNVGVSLLGRDSFQEVDIQGVTMPVTKHNYIVKDVEELAQTVRDAFRIAQEGRPGPVLIDIPKDVTAHMTRYEPVKPEKPKKRTELITDAALTRAADMIAASKKPFLYAGGGIIASGAAAELMAFAEVIQAPVSTSLMAIGSFPADHPLFTGMIGMHGSKTTNLAVSECDLLIAVGVRFSDRATSNVAEFAPKAKILQIDIDPAEINKNVPVAHHIVGDAKAVLQRLTPLLYRVERTAWSHYIQQMKDKYPLMYMDVCDVMPQTIIRKIRELAGPDAIVSTEVGQHQMWTAQHYGFSKPRTFLTSGGLGTMGFGLGAAIGAQVAMPDRRVINIAGDGSFRMNLTELATAVEYDLPIIEVIMDNRVLGMVRQWQDMFYDKRYSHTTIDRSTDFVRLAESFGAMGLRINTQEEIEPVLRQAFEAKRTVVIDCLIGEDIKVFPMVAPGKAIAEVIIEADLS
jgi:acetolactate synthase-1/2/3 large subunit